jgi:haloalkane dehalogenase
MASAIGADTGLYPFKSHFIELPGARMHYVDEGRGEPVVMLHGNPTWSFYFRDLIKTLRGDYRVIAPDHVGCGQSDKPGDDRYRYTLDRRVADLETLLDSLGLTSDLTFVLHDWGGMIGMTYASRHAERVKRFVILNTAAFLLPAGKRLPRSLWLCRNTPLGPLLVRGLNGFCRGAIRYCAMRPMAPAVRQGYLAPYNSWSNRIAIMRFVQDIPLNPSDAAYATVRSVQEWLDQFRDRPMLICWGEKDFVFDVHFLEEWKKRFPAAEVHRFPDAGHYVLEDAGGAIVPLVREFLRQHPLAHDLS